jgi:hypothetical protein
MRIPSPLVRFLLRLMFETDVEELLREERSRLLASPRFRYDEQEVLELFERIGDRAREYAVFSAQDFDAALEKNVKLLFNYVCRPQWTLVKYVFADREHAAVDEVLDALRIFRHYEYFQIILREYFEKKSIPVINVKKFTELIDRIDNEVVRNLDSRKTAHLAEPIYELFNLGVAEEDRSAPVEALSIFYDDKNLASIVERLDHERHNQERMTLHDLVLLIGEADFTLGMDISTIVNERLVHMGGMKKERDATAGRDFDVPNLNEYQEEGPHRGDLGHEHDALDFIISEEEQGVIMQDHDHMTSPLEDDTSDTIEVDEFRLEETEEDEDADHSLDAESIEDHDFSGYGESEHANADSDEFEPEVPAASGLKEHDDFEEEEMDSTGESILRIEEELSVAPTESDGDLLASGLLSDDSEIPDILLEDEFDAPSPQFLESKDVIPDFSLDEIDAIELDEEETQTDAYGTGLGTEDVYLVTETDVSDAGASVVGDELLSDPASPAEETDDDIDWEKEAEDLEDVDLESDDTENVSDSLAPSDDPFKQVDELKPAEELLGQLDLDDFEDLKTTEKRRQDDIPVVEEALQHRPASRVVTPATDEAEPEPSVPVEQVIAEFGDLGQQISDSDKKKYVKKLFQKNDEAFSRALVVLNGKPSWREASEYIDELFIKFDVDMYSRLAVKFTDDIYKRYAKKK